MDASVCLRFNQYGNPKPVTTIFRLVSKLGDGPFWLAMLVGMPIIYGNAAAPALVRGFLVGTAAFWLYRALKTKTGRARPYVAGRGIIRRLPPLDQFSFPSGHTMHAVSFSVVLAAPFPELALMLYPFALLVALSRMILGLHYPSDVMAGALIGYALAKLSLWLWPLTSFPV